MKHYNPWTTCLGKVFLQIAPYLRVYTQYVNNVDNAMEVLADCKKNRRGFEKFVDECAARLRKAGHRQTVASLAIMPVQVCDVLCVCVCVCVFVHMKVVYVCDE
jgi:RhoGEF domain